MSFSIKRLFVFPLVMLCALIITPFSLCQSLEDQMIDYSNLPGLRTMANQPVNPEAGMEVGNVDIPSITKEEGSTKQMTSEQFLPEALPVFFDKNKIDPTEYVIGSDDLLNVYLWGELDRQFNLTVSPEGTINIPTAGTVEVSGHSLAEAKDIVKKFVSRKYSGLDISVSLVRPRYFRLYVSGVVSRAGAVTSHPLQRVSDVVERAGLNIMEIENITLTRQQEQEYQPSLR
ncbi:MAG: polysaccharide biosynthesis/export family protein, partial [Candidatus Latescibacterota bacterium]